MKYTKTVILAMLLAAGMACGYSKPRTVTPMLSQLNPAAAAHGSGQFQLEVDGSNFAGNAVINFNNAKQATTFASSGKLTAMIPASAIMTAGPVSVTVTNPGSGGVYGMGPVTSPPMTFTIN